jgi:pilus assembly protein Flp/PilA
MARGYLAGTSSQVSGVAFIRGAGGSAPVPGLLLRCRGATSKGAAPLQFSVGANLSVADSPMRIDRMHRLAQGTPRRRGSRTIRPYSRAVWLPTLPAPNSFGKEVPAQMIRDFISNLLARFQSEDEEGQTLVEYGLLLALIAIIVIVALLFLGPLVSDIFSNVGNQLT